MKKDRFVAFFDAVMAIIMTIVVLEFVVPDGTKWSDLSVLWFQILAYALSFFWLGTMWINLHSVWDHVKVVTRPILFVNLFTLFFSSMIPFFTVYLGRHIGEKIPQVLFGIDVMLVTICNAVSNELLAKSNEEIKERLPLMRNAFFIDGLIKVAGIIIGYLFVAQGVMLSTFFSVIFVAIIFGIGKKKLKKKIAE